jgi:antirestriction protein
MSYDVWVSTRGLYNNGMLIGYWVAATEAPLTIDEFLGELILRQHEVPAKALACVGEELWCFDVDFDWCEMSVEDAHELGAILEEIEEHGHVEEYLAYAENMYGMATIGGRKVIEVEEFADAYIGTFDSLENYVQEYVVDLGELGSVSPFLSSYIDYERLGRDMILGGDIWETRVSGGHAIFHNV